MISLSSPRNLVDDSDVPSNLKHHKTEVKQKFHEQRTEKQIGMPSLSSPRKFVVRVPPQEDDTSHFTAQRQ